MSQPAHRGEYPPDWKEIATACKDAADWKCERCQHHHAPECGYCLTVHHFDGDKANVEGWNLMALCQRCHLSVQARVDPAVGLMFDPSAWANPYSRTASDESSAPRQRRMLSRSSRSSCATGSITAAPTGAAMSPAAVAMLVVGECVLERRDQHGVLRCVRVEAVRAGATALYPGCPPVVVGRDVENGRGGLMFYPRHVWRKATVGEVLVREMRRRVAIAEKKKRRAA